MLLVLVGLVVGRVGIDLRRIADIGRYKLGRAGRAGGRIDLRAHGRAGCVIEHGDREHALGFIQKRDLRFLRSCCVCVTGDGGAEGLLDEVHDRAGFVTITVNGGAIKAGKGSAEFSERDVVFSGSRGSFFLGFVDGGIALLFGLIRSIDGFCQISLGFAELGRSAGGQTGMVGLLRLLPRLFGFQEGDRAVVVLDTKTEHFADALEEALDDIKGDGDDLQQLAVLADTDDGGYAVHQIDARFGRSEDAAWQVHRHDRGLVRHHDEARLVSDVTDLHTDQIRRRRAIAYRAGTGVGRDHVALRHRAARHLEERRDRDADIIGTTGQLMALADIVIAARRIVAAEENERARMQLLVKRGKFSGDAESQPSYSNGSMKV